MANVIKKIADSKGIHRYIRNIDIVNYPIADWLHDPDVSALDAVSEIYWKVSGSPLGVSEMIQSEKDAVDAALIETRAFPNIYGEFIFGNWGRTSNRWLRTGGFSMSSNRMPYVTFNAGYISGLEYLNYRNNSDSDIEIYINGTLAYTWQIRDKQSAYKTNGLSQLTFIEGDKISVRCKKAGTIDPVYTMVRVQYRYNLHLTGEGGNATI